MSYRSLALEWRPSTFSEVVSQVVPVTILRNSIAKKEIFPGLVFWGSAGSGKTSCARIYAKALNCPKYNGDVCGTCDSCVKITNGAGSLAYMEIDAASHGHVDDVHELVKNLQHQVPGEAHRVVTIDECHMMTDAAWNAMLKVLEEPPAHVVFIFVTTEVRKVKETILSRCFALQFHRIGQAEIMAHLRKIAADEGLQLGEGVLEAIARRSDGRMRDAVTLLEQLSVLGGKTGITTAILEQVGVCGQDVYARFVDQVYSGDTKAGLELVRHWLSSMGPAEFLKGLEDYLHRMFLDYNGITVSLVRPQSKIAWFDLNECIGRVWEMQDVVRSHYSQPRLETMLARMFINFGAARTESADKSPTNAATDVRPLSISAGPKSWQDVQRALHG